MGRRSTRDNKTIYQLCREETGLTREKAGELMDGMSASRIDKIEREEQSPTPYDVVQMANAYNKPELCNIFCTETCEIGRKYQQKVEVTDLSDITLETIASLNDLLPMTGRLIQIARDGRISEDEIRDFALISSKLDEIAKAITALDLWIEKTAGRKGLDRDKLMEEKEKLRK